MRPNAAIEHSSTSQRRHLALTELGHLALSDAEAAALFDAAVHIVAEHLGAALVTMYERSPAGNAAFLVASSRASGPVGRSPPIMAGPETMLGRVWTEGAPVIVEEPRDGQIPTPPGTGLSGPLGSVCAAIPGRQGPWGALRAFFSDRHLLDAADTLLLASVATLLGSSIERARGVEEAARAGEERFRSITQRSSEIIAILTAEGIVTWISPGFERALGYPAAHVVGATGMDLLYPDDVPATLAALAHSRDHPGEEIRGKTRVRRSDGDLRLMEVSGFNLLDDAYVAGIVVTFRDITERRAAEDALRASEERYRRIVETAREGIWSIDFESRTTFVNETMAAMLGYSVADILGRSIYEFMDAEWTGIIAPKLEARKRGIGEEYEARLLRKDGAGIWCLINVTPIQDDDGRFVGSLAMITDITERRRLDEQRRASERQFQALVESTPDFVVRFDRQYRYLYANPGTCQAYGLELADILGRTFRDLTMRPELADRLEQVMEAAFTTGQRQTYEFEMIIGAAHVWLHGIVVPERNEAGEVETVLAVGHDINDLRRAQEERQALLERERAARAAAEAEQARVAFLAAAGEALATSLEVDERLAAVARLAIPTLGDWCIVDFIGSSGLPRQAFVAHVDPSQEATLQEFAQRYPPDLSPDSRYAAILGSERTFVANDIDDAWLTGLARDAEHLSLLRRLDPRAYLMVALVARGRAIGSITVATSRPGRRYAGPDVELVQEFAQRTAMQVENSLLLHDAQAAEERSRAQADRLRVLTRAGKAFAGAGQRVNEVVASVIHEVVGLMRGGGFVRLLGEDGMLHVVTVSRPAYDDDDVAFAALSRPLAVDRPPFDAVMRGEVVRIETHDAESTRGLPDDYLAASHRVGIQTILVVPLRAGERIIGTLGVSRLRASDPFTDDDPLFFLELADRATLAIENARLLEEATTALHAASARAERLRVLARASRVFSEASLTIEGLLEPIVHEVVAALDGRCTVRLIGADRRLYTASVRQPSYIPDDEWTAILGRPFDLDEEPIATLVRGQSVHIADLATDPFRAAFKPDYLAALEALDVRSIALTPLRARGEMLGSIGVSRTSRATSFSEDDLTFLQELADRAALAIDNARLYEQERAQAQRLRVLSELSRALAEAPFDLDLLGQVICRMVGESIGDSCLMRLMSDDGHSLEIRGVFHPNPQMAALLNDLARIPLALGEGLAGRSAATGQAVLIPRIDQQELAGLTGERFAHYYRSQPIYSSLVVPLLGRGRVIGTLSLARLTPERPYTEEDRDFLTSLADRAALAIDNARLFVDQQELAQQRNQALTEIAELNASLELRVQERTTELEVANQELEAFAYSVTHDLRAPLRSIDGFSLALLEDYAAQLDAAGQEYLQRVRNASQRMGRLIDDLLALSRVTRSAMEREPVDLSELAAAILESLSARVPERALETRIEPNLITRGDQHLLQIVLQNLLENAWKFTSARPLARIEIGRDTSTAPPAFYVRDNGAGFDMRYADRLFTAFQRLHATTQFEGTGIGLATVQRIIQRHGGQVWAEARVDEGATFFFSVESGTRSLADEL